MGAVNYGSGEYINIGVDLREELDNDFQETLREAIENKLDDCFLQWFDVSIQPGYYDGFYIDISSKFDFITYLDKLEAQKEVTRLKQFLFWCIGMGLVQYFPGWCTGYSTDKESKQAILEAVRKMRKDINVAQTWIQYSRDHFGK